MQVQSPSVDKRVYDKLAYAAIKAIEGRVDKSQVNKLIEFLNQTSDIELTLIFLARQVARGEWDPVSAKLLSEAIKETIKDVSTNYATNYARKILGIFKWFYEIAEVVPEADRRSLSKETTIDGMFEKLLNLALSPRR